MTGPDAVVAVAATTLWDSRESVHILTQLLLGEPVVMLEERHGWAEVCAPWQPSGTEAGGYRGWIRSEHLEAPLPATGLIATVTVPTTTLVTGNRGVDVSWATSLPVLERAGPRVEVVLPGGATGLLDPAAVALRGPGGGGTLDPLAPVRAARQFLGLEYFWGGTTGWGLDCSGLVHLAHRSHGVRVPRDAADQQRSFLPVDLAEVRSGDLYFFGKDGRITHVGFATSPGGDEPRTMLHAPERSRHIEEVPLPPERLATLVSAGRVTNPTWLSDQNSF